MDLNEGSRSLLEHLVFEAGADEALRLVGRWPATASLTDERGRSALHLLAQREFDRQPTRDAAIARLLLKAGADPAQADHAGLTPLQIAAWYRNSAMVAVLLDYGADAASTGAGWPALHIAIGGDPLQDEELDEVIDRLLQSTIDVNQRGPGGVTALHLAVNQGASLVRKLLAVGADPNIPDDDGRTSLHYASCYRNVASLRALLSAGARTEMRDTAGRTPAEVALEHGLLDVAALVEPGRAP